MSKVVAIHQPNFFPWLGYFNKIALSDTFILLDDVQFPKKGGSWSNRVRIIVSCEEKWITANIVRNYHGVRNINEMELQPNLAWRSKILKTITMNYRRAPFFDEMIYVISPLLMSKENNLAKYNCHSILSIVDRLGIDRSKLVKSSDIRHLGSSNELLIDLTKKVGGTTYMCGGGAEGYQDEDKFNLSSVALKHQNFDHPVYNQTGVNDFISGLSIIDAVANSGWDVVSEMVKFSDL